jgi:hypothetical protein
MFTSQKNTSIIVGDFSKVFKKVLIVFSLIVIQLSFFYIVDCQAISRLSNKGAWTILKEMGYDMNSIPFKDYGNGLYGISTNNIAVIFLCDQEGYPTVCKIECHKDDPGTMFMAMQMLIWKSSGVDIVNGEYLYDKIHQAIYRGENVDIWLPKTHAMYHILGDLTEPNSNVLRLLVLRELR